MVGFAKRILPVFALALLALVALWPEIVEQADRARIVYGRGSLALQTGMLTSPRYRGEDDNSQPYTLTATSARQIGEERIDLVQPVGDIQLSGGAWLQVQSVNGIYMQKAGQLDLAGDVILYRDDGTTLTTDAATLDLHGGALAAAGQVHVEGPFGTLDAQGMTITERGHVAQFTGPGRLVLNGGQK
jgi:lipopolysaccharide export system protein LptC